MYDGLQSVTISMPPHFVYTKCVFEWDPRKTRANADRHAVTFDEALTVFFGWERTRWSGRETFGKEARFLRLGRASGGRLLIVAYTLRRSGDAETTRIISARRAE